MRELCTAKRGVQALFVVCWLLLCAAPLRAVQATLTADAHVSAAQPAVNAGALSNLDVGSGYTSLVQFDLGVLPATATAAQIARATLRVYCNRADTPGSVSVQPVYGSWTEGGLAYANLPVLGTAIGTAQVSGAGYFVTFDVTAQVQGWVNAPGSNFGLALSSTAAFVQFDSKENDQTAHAPQLEIALVAGSAGSGTSGAAGVTGATGATGGSGAVGVTGATGATGVAGAAGVRGATGVTGATGAQGPAGAGLVNYQGTYSAQTNYSNGDVVVFGGSTYISQTGTNHGNTPGLTTAWGLLASVGAPGVTGAVGVTGATGQQGPPGYGVQGATGAVGATGATGVAGSPGLVYRGTYSSVENYSLGDVVLWSGASYVSQVSANHGNTPGLVPGLWGVLTAQGPQGVAGSTGAAGPTGVTGALGPVGPPGERGDQGAQGIAGQAGAQGIPGATGATGLQGPMGSTGPAGPVGMSFQGPYSAGTNYSLGQAVLWQGSGWVSLANSNHGNTPDGSPSMWALFATSGAAGATGTTGYGQTGATGATGIAGTNGVNGATGPTGAAGAPGLVYQGPYSSGMNYALGDVVLWGGSSYVSLSAGNHGNTPGAGNAAWGVLTSQGPAGATGAAGGTGATGITGAVGGVGPAGAQGPTGATGVAGPGGAQGIAGAAGATGSPGPAGATGPAGPVGLSFQGSYSASVNYSLGQGILWQGSGWVSLINNNQGHTPDSSPSNWALFASVGSTGSTGATGAGLTGATGATGAAGATGATGTAGAMGATGAVGMRWMGAYASGTGYIAGDAVSYGGASYLSLVNNNHGQAPDQSPSSWNLLAAQGAAGTAGVAGATGATGANGAAGAAGAAGVAGVTGATGAQGAVGINYRAAWSQSQHYAVNDAVTFAGSSYLAQSSTQSQEPDQYPQVWAVLAEAGGVGPTGVAGATGSAGAAATVTVGSVTTLPAGSQATVNNSGTSTAAVLNFGIPQGSSAGTGSTTVPRVPAMYHAVSFNYPYYAVNTSVSGTAESGSVLAWMPQSCTATRLDVYSQQTGTIKVTLRLGSATTLNSTTLACSATPNSSCVANGAVTVTAGQFVDLLVQNASGTAAGVWTALECDP